MNPYQDYVNQVNIDSHCSSMVVAVLTKELDIVL